MTRAMIAARFDWGHHALRVLSVAAFSLLAACSGLPSPTEGDDSAAKKAAESLINGVDQRLDWQDNSEIGMVRLGSFSTAAVMPSSRVLGSAQTGYSFNAPTLQQVRNLCTGERFAAEQTAADCAATLIDKDLVITPAHCISPQTCADTRFVFGYYYAQHNPPGVSSAVEVASCQSVVVSEASPGDWAFVRLSAPVSAAHSPAPVRSNRTALAVGSSLFAIGFPDGTPEKLSAGNLVTGQDPSVLTTNVDAFARSDGTALYTDTYELAGLITNPTQGALDYTPGPAGSSPAGCNVAKTCPEAGCAGSASTGFYIGPAIDAYCQLDPNNKRLCRERNAVPFSFQPTFTHGITTLKNVFLEPGATIDFGTCITPGSSTTSGDTYIGLIDPDLMRIADNDNGGGNCGLGSHTTYTVPRALGGQYLLTAGCSTLAPCSGTVAYAIAGPTGGSFAYSAIDTQAATVGTRDVSIALRAGETLTAGSCGLEDTGFTGDTVLRLFQGTSQLTWNDDACGNVGSQLSYTASSAVTVTLKAGCFNNSPCDARVSYQIGVSSSGFSASNTNSNQQNSVTKVVHLVAGDKLTVGTCGLPGASFSGDTVVGVYQGSTPGATNDDACASIGSRVTFRAPSTADYTVRLGCYGSSSCSGTAVFRITPPDSVSTAVSFSAQDSNMALGATGRQQFYLRAGDIFSTGTCPSLPGASGTGDTFIRLYAPSGADVYDSDDNCTVGSSVLSAINNVMITPETEGSYLLRMGCYANNACSGNEAYVLQ